MYTTLKNSHGFAWNFEWRCSDHVTIYWQVLVETVEQQLNFHKLEKWPPRGLRWFEENAKITARLETAIGESRAFLMEPKYRHVYAYDQHPRNRQAWNAAEWPLAWFQVTCSHLQVGFSNKLNLRRQRCRIEWLDRWIDSSWCALSNIFWVQLDLMKCLAVNRLKSHVTEEKFHEFIELKRNKLAENQIKIKIRKKNAPIICISLH